MIQRPPLPTLFPYTTLFRSHSGRGCDGLCRRSRAGSRRSQTRADRKSTRLNSSHVKISYAVFCLKQNKEFHVKATFAYRRCPDVLMIPTLVKACYLSPPCTI